MDSISVMFYYCVTVSPPSMGSPISFYYHATEFPQSFPSPLSVELPLRYMEINAGKIIYVFIPAQCARLKNCKTFYRLIYINGLLILFCLTMKYNYFLSSSNELEFNFSIMLVRKNTHVSSMTNSK